MSEEGPGEAPGERPGDGPGDGPGEGPGERPSKCRSQSLLRLKMAMSRRQKTLKNVVNI